MPLNFTSTYTDIVSRIISDIRDNTPISNFGESSTSRAIAESVATVLSDMHSRIDLLFSSLDVDLARGDFLDKIGSLFGLTRKGGTRAVSDTAVVFYLAPGWSISQLVEEVNDTSGMDPITSIEINSGIVLTSYADEDVAYETTATFTLDDVNDPNEAIPVPVQAMGIGYRYNIDENVLARHTIGQMQWQLRPITDRILVKNIQPIESGGSIEDDESFRARIKAARLAAVTGNETALRNAAMEVSGVGEVMISRYPEGLGTIGLVILPESGIPVTSTAVLNNVYEAVNDMVSAGCRAVVSTPEYLMIYMKARLSFNTSISGELARQEGLKLSAKQRLIDWNNALPMGARWSRAAAIKTIMEVSPKEIIGVEIIDDEFRIKPYYRAVKASSDGRSRLVTNLNNNIGYGGTRIVSEEIVAKLSNPPQKFLMNNSSITIC